MAEAPVCHVSSDQVIAQPPARIFPVVPKATDLASALKAIQSLTQIVNMLSGQAPSPPPDFFGGLNSNLSRPPKPPPLGRWVEFGRTKEVVRVFNPQDKEQWVDIERINSLDLHDQVTGEVWHWQRKL